jgi:hypothetical protein
MGLGVLSVQWVEEDRVVVRHPPGVPLGGSWLDCFADVRPVEAGKTHLMLPPLGKKDPQALDVLHFLLAAVTGTAPPARQSVRSTPTDAARTKRPRARRLPWE